MVRTNIRVSALITKDDKILLIHRFKKGNEYWVVPGGGVEEGESIEQTLNREVMEETGLIVLKNKMILNEKVMEVFGEADHYIFKCETENKKPVLGGPEFEANCADNSYHLEWVEIDLLPDLVLYPRLILKCRLD